MRRTGFARTFVGAALLSLAGCGPLEHAIEKARYLDAEHKFGAASRERLDSDPEGRTFRMMVESTAEANWLEASVAMSRRKHCDDGQSMAPIETVPDRQTPPDGYVVMHPAGTTFIETYRCAGPLAGEFEVAANTDAESARELVTGKLRAAAAVDSPERIETQNGTLIRFVVTQTSFGPRRTKYDAIRSYVGTMMSAAHDACGGPTTLRQVVVATWPRKPKVRGREPFEDMIIGTEIECAAAATAAPESVADA